MMIGLHNPARSAVHGPDTQGARVAQAEVERGTWRRAIHDFKRQYITEALVQSGGNRTRTAKALGLTRHGLIAMIRHLKITVPPPPRA